MKKMIFTLVLTIVSSVCMMSKAQINSLCDEWNVLTTVIYEYNTRYLTFSQKLTTDTIIGENMYVKSEFEHKYNGAYREGENRDIYFVPAAMNKEFLVYAWNAQVGDTLYNILVSSYPIYALQYSDKAVVREIKETTPRTFIVDYEYIYNRKIDSADTIWWEYQWIEGIGMTCGPSGDLCPFDKCRDSIKSDLLCAYKNGEQIYTSALGEQYGCEYNRHTFNYLCDEWNVLHETFSWPGGYNTFKYFLSTDTLINSKPYVKLVSDKDYPYCGAFREDFDANIYYIPSGSTHEYLIYAFNAQTGDTLSNLWVGGFGEGYQGVVQAISTGSPRIFTIGVKIYENSEYNYPIQWIDGVGSPETPMGIAVVPTIPADIGVFNLLCAYKNGQQAYATQLSERYGCFYEGRNPPPTTDTIPLYSYTGDDPGSSTVDPVDPNQVVVTLKGDVLTVKETSGDVITYSVQIESGNNAPKRMQTLFANTFQDSVSVELTEEGLYRLDLSNPLWDYHIYGIFNYPQRHDAIDWIIAPTPAAQKIIRNGQLLIRKGEKVYTLQGSEVKE